MPVLSVHKDWEAGQGELGRRRRAQQGLGSLVWEWRQPWKAWAGLLLSGQGLCAPSGVVGATDRPPGHTQSHACPFSNTHMQRHHHLLPRPPASCSSLSLGHRPSLQLCPHLGLPPFSAEEPGLCSAPSPWATLSPLQGSLRPASSLC